MSDGESQLVRIAILETKLDATLGKIQELSDFVTNHMEKEEAQRDMTNRRLVYITVLVLSLHIFELGRDPVFRLILKALGV